MKLASLFTRPRFKRVSLAQEMDAVRRGTKPLAFFSSSRDSLEDGSDLIDTMKTAFDRELSVALLPQDGDVVNVIVFRANESRRVGAFQSFLVEKRKAGWTFAAEDEMSRLLGYSAAQRAEWMKRERASYIGYGMSTVYAISFAGLDAVDRLFTGSGAVYPSARAKLPRGTNLLRVGLDRRSAWKLFGSAPKSAVPEITLTNAKRKILLAGILAGPEVLGPRGWRPV